MSDIILKTLKKSIDLKYKEFSSSLTPSINKDVVLGIRAPVLKEIAKTFYGTNEGKEFLENLPHKYYEENNLHAYMLVKEKDFDRCLELVDNFLPYVDNWATCDVLRPKCFSKNKNKLLGYIDKWIKSDKEYTVRFAIGVLTSYFLDDDFKDEHLIKVASVLDDRYYVKMMVAWYFATALAKKYDKAVKIIEDRLLDPWTHNKAIQKAIESYRVEDAHKQYLRTLKIK